MCCLKIFALIFLYAYVAPIQAAKMVCYYDSSTFLREGDAHFSIPELSTSLPFCHYLVYGYAGIDPENYQLKPLNKDLDIMRNHYRSVTNLRRDHPHLLVLLSVGGDHDLFDESLGNPYLRLLEDPAHRTTFINSVLSTIQTYQFDGIDLAWQFPKNPPKVVESGFKKFVHKVKSWFTGSKVVDEQAEEHKMQFAVFVRELKNALRRDGLMLSVTMLPHVDAALFMDIPNIMPFVDFVNLGSYDFQTPMRDPNIADHTAPIYEMFERDPTHNINYQVEYWLNNSAPANKLNVGIAAYGRTWIMTRDSGITGYPPIPSTNGPAPAGRLTQTPGLLSWPEICEKLHRNTELEGDAAPLRKVGDPRNRYGTYAYRAVDEEGNFGLFVGYEEPSTAAIKAGYVYAKGLGGVALFDLSMDDVRGQCAGERFPILRSIKFKL